MGLGGSTQDNPGGLIYLWFLKLLLGLVLEKQFSTYWSLITPLGLHIRYHAYQIYIYIMIHNSSKITVMKQQQKVLWLEVTTTRGTILQSHNIRKVENHCCKNYARQGQAG